MWPAVLRSEIHEFFAPFQGPVYKGFDDWQGADVAIATGWQTVHATLQLDHCRARAYIVNDHEPEFYAASTEHALAADTYRYGLHCIAASPWLRDLLIERYGASAEAFQLGVDHDTYHPRPVARQPDTVIYYARYVTPRRAVPIGLMALAELKRRRPDVRIVLFGTERSARRLLPLRAPRRAQPRAALVAVLRSDRRPVPVADQLLADAQGDARLRAAVRRARRHQRRVDLRLPTARSSSRRSIPTASPTRWSGCSRIQQALAAALDAKASSSSPRTPGSTPPTRSKPGLRHALRERERAVTAIG